MKIAIFGASGQGREVADICALLGYEEIVFLVCDINEKCIWPFDVHLDTKEKIKELSNQDFDFAIGIGSPKIRKKLYQKYPHLTYPNIIHPSATFGLFQREHIDQSKGNLINAGVRFTNNIQCGDFGLYNLNATIAHDSIVEEFVSIMADVNISGNVHVKEGAYIGVNATILHGTNDQKMLVGENSIVGAGAVVTKSVPANATVVGVPARTQESVKV